MKLCKLFSPGALTLKGPVGKALAKNISSRLETMDYSLMVDPFRLRSENDGAWRCEFWGKNVRAAILSWHLMPSDILLQKIKSTVKDMLSTQTPDGCISSYPADKQISGWDVWGRKYVLLALLRYYRLIEADPEVLRSCCKLVDHLISQLAGSKKDLRSCGMHGGLASCSIVGGIIELYELTKEKRFLEFARTILESGCSLKENVFDAALNGVSPKDIGNAKAYELSSCFEGASAFYQVTGEKRYKEAVEKYFSSVVEKEILVTGTAGGKDDCGEFWFDGVKNQISPPPGSGLGETCVTVTYMRFCNAVAALDENNQTPFDEMENSLYNALLGAMDPSGERWTHANPNPLTGGGWKSSAPDQIKRWFHTPFDEHDCCRAQGPEGLAFGAAHAVLKSSDGIIVNFYEDSVLQDTTASGEKYSLEISGGYPASGKSELCFRAQQPLPQKIVLRIPAWAEKCELFLNGKRAAVSAGKYCTLDRIWSDGDLIRIDFHPEIKVIRPAGTSDFFALKYGPVVLAESGNETIAPDPCGSWDVYPGGEGKILNVKQGKFNACDYASAGSEFSPDDSFRVFFPQKRGMIMKKLGPQWLKNAVFYQIYPSSFADSNGDGMGDLQGIIGKLDYLADLGINALWINPCFCSTFRDGGYDVSDYRRVDPRFGTDADLDMLIAEAHKRNIRICLDIVAGHTSTDHPWFRASAEAEPNEYSNYYIWTDDWMRPTDGFQMEAGIGNRNGCFLINYFSVQPALNYGFAKPDPKRPWQLPVDHPDVLKVREELKDIFRFYLAKGVDGFRVDMACSLVKRDPGKKETIKLWQEIREMFDREYPEAALISEWTYAPQALKAGFHCDFMIHCGTPGYTTLFRNESKRDIFNKFIRERFFEPDGNDYRTPNRNSYFDAAGKGSAKMFFDIYLDHWQRTKSKGFISIPSGNHDLPRISDFRSEKELKTVFAFLLTMPGIPFIYYGDEIGMRNLKDLPSKEGGYSRTQARTPMQWDDSASHGFSTASAEKLYLPVDDSADAPTVKSQLNDPDSLLNCVKKLISVRQSSAALQSCGKIELLHCDYPTVYLRSFGKERYLIALQPADKPFERSIKVPGVKKLIPAYSENMDAAVSGKGIVLSGSGVGFGIYRIG